MPMQIVCVHMNAELHLHAALCLSVHAHVHYCVCVYVWCRLVCVGIFFVVLIFVCACICMHAGMQALYSELYTQPVKSFFNKLFHFCGLSCNWNWGKYYTEP